MTFPLPREVVAIDLSQAIADERYCEIVRRYLAREADYVAHGFIALNTAFISGGAFVYIPQGVVLTTPIHLLFISEGNQTANFPRVLVVAEANSSATLIESYVSTADDTYFTNAVVEIVLEEGARLEHYKVQRESAEAFQEGTLIEQPRVRSLAVEPRSRRMPSPISSTPSCTILVRSWPARSGR